MTRWTSLVLVAALAACDSSTETTYDQYNADDNAVTVQVGVETVYQTDDNGDPLLDDAGDPVPEAVSVTLTSTSGEFELGTASVSPSAGPIGTVHTARVELDDDYASNVDKVSIRTDSGDRGEDSYDLDADSTGEGVWTLEIRSYGEEGETREDTVTFLLYEAVETEEEDTGEGFTLF